MAQIDKERLSDAMRRDVEDYEISGYDAIYWLGNGIRKTTDQVITRLQSARIVEVALSGLKTVDDWSLGSSALTKIKTTVPPMSKNNKYSSYALKEKLSSMGNLRYPLCSSFASKNILFSNKTFPNYNAFKQRIKDSFNIKITEKTNKDEMFTYTRTGRTGAFLKNKGLGFLNLCSKMFKSHHHFYTGQSYKGRMVINNNYTYRNGSSYKISEQEKSTRILDAVLGVAVDDICKINKLKFTNQEKFAARLFAGILMSRAINYGDTDSNIKVESSLTLQFSNVIAALDLDPEKLADIGKLGSSAAHDCISKMNITVEEIVESCKNAGYEYSKEPTTVQEALYPDNGRPYVNENIDVRTGYITNIIPRLTTAPVYNLPQESTTTTEKSEETTYKPNFVLKDEDVIDVTPIESVDDGKPKVSTKPNLTGVKTTQAQLSKLAATRYIDRVFETSFKKLINKSLSGMSKSEVKGGKKQVKFARQYNFVEHLLAYYNNNKKRDTKVLQEEIDKEFASNIIGDNNYAHSIAEGFIELKEFILNELFKGEKHIDKVDGKGIATVINDFVQEKFGRGLAGYTTNILTKSFTNIFKEIDQKTYDRKNLFTEAEATHA